jgi:hypothetical protein
MRWLGISLIAAFAACGQSQDAGDDNAPEGDSSGSGGSGGGAAGTSGHGGALDAGKPLDASASPDAAKPLGTGGRPDSGGSGGSAGGPPHLVQACPGIDGGGAGVWENITPPGIGFPKWCTPQWNSTCPGPGETSADGTLATYGTNAIAIDPSNTATVYLGTSSLGLFKTTDCGATWAHISTGANGTKIDQGRNWTMVIDPTNTQVLYTTAGYGMGDVYKSTNGGVDWEPMLTPDVRTALAGGFVEKITMDPTNHLHLLASAHGPCTKNGTNYGCLAESTDEGTTWSFTSSAESWSEGDGQTMVDDKTWFFGALFGGIWRTTDAGGSWTQVYKGNAAGSVYIAADGTFYTCGGNGVMHSTDGVAWTVLSQSPRCGGNSNGGNMIAGDGKTMFISDGNGLGWGQTQPPADGWYWSAPESSSTTWTSLHSPASMMEGGISIAYDPDHHILYSSNYVAGFWRVVVP